MDVINHQSPTAPARINEARDQMVRSGFFYAGKQATFQTRPNDVALITGRVAKIQAMQALGQVHPDFYWRAADDTDHLFTPTEFLQFAIALDSWVESKYIESWQAKAAL